MISTQFCLLGPPQISFEGKRLEEKLSGKALALVYYLAVERRPIGREILASLLWPNTPPSLSKRYLRNLLVSVRKVFPKQLQSDRNVVQLILDDERALDLFQLQQGLEALNRGEEMQGIEQIKVQQARLELYRGDFLEGFHIIDAAPFEEWLQQERESLRQQFLTGVSTLADAFAAHAAYEEALATIGQLIALSPWSESAIVRQMQWLVALGRSGEALRWFERHRLVLADEYNASPAPDVIGLYESIRHGTYAPAGDSTERQHFFGQTLPPNNLFSHSHAERPFDNINHVARGGAEDSTIDEIVYHLQRPDLQLLLVHSPDEVASMRLVENAMFSILQQRWGKSRFADGIYLVRMADSTVDLSAADLLLAIANTLGIRGRASAPLGQLLQEYLAERKVLLLFDTVAPTTIQARQLLMLLRAAPSCKALISLQQWDSYREATHHRIVAPNNPHQTVDSWATATPRARLLHPTLRLRDWNGHAGANAKLSRKRAALHCRW